MRWKAALVVGGLLLVAIGGALVLVWIRNRPRAFESQVWIRHARSGDRDNPRFYMRAHVLEMLREGMSMGAVRSLLGPPNREVEVLLNGQLDGEWYYYLGMHSGFGVDEDVLHLGFKDGTVVCAHVRQH